MLFLLLLGPSGLPIHHMDRIGSVRCGTTQAAIVEPATRPTLKIYPADARFKIVTVVGMAQYRDSADQPWRKCTTGVEVGMTAEVRVGPKSSISLSGPDGEAIRCDRLGTLKLERLLLDPNLRERTPGIDHPGEITTPSSTLAIRGLRFAGEREINGRREFVFICDCGVEVNMELPPRQPAPGKK